MYPYSICILLGDGDMDSKQRLGNRIKAIRTEMKLSQEELAFRCGIDAAQIGYIERGQRSATLETFEKIAHGLGITLSELTNYEQDPDVQIFDETINKIVSISLGLEPAERTRALMLLKALAWKPESKN